MVQTGPLLPVELPGIRMAVRQHAAPSVLPTVASLAEPPFEERTVVLQREARRLDPTVALRPGLPVFLRRADTLVAQRFVAVYQRRNVQTLSADRRADARFANRVLLCLHA